MHGHGHGYSYSRAKARPGTVIKKAVGTATLALETYGAAKAWWRFLMTVEQLN